jgi:hypothetical protein
MTKEQEEFHRMWEENEPEDGVLCAPAGLPVRNKARPRDMLHDQDQTLTPPPEDQPRPYAEVENLPGDPDQDDEEQREEGGLGGANPDNGDALATPNLSREGVKHPVDPEMIMLPTLNTEPFYRIQWAGDSLSKSFKSSHVQSGEEEEGLSASHSLPDLVKWVTQGNASPIGHVEVVKFHGRRLGTGSDNEPLVEPVQELSRHEHQNFKPQHWRSNPPKTTDDLLSQGWKRVKKKLIANEETIQLPTLNVDGGTEFRTYKVVDGDTEQE